MKWLVQELAQRGLTVSPRAAEGWAARGLAPAPIRRSLGRGRGMVSEYPPGAVDQYAAVAALMRRGRPWQISVMKLLVRGHLPTDEDLVRQALGELLTPPEAPPGEDALDYAERVAAEAAAAPFARRFMRAYERNLRRATPILEPGTQIPPVAVGVVATLTLLRMGQPVWTHEALTEMLAAHGIPVAELADGQREDLAQAADAFLKTVFAGPGLAQFAAEVSVHRLQAAIPQGLVEGQKALESLSKKFPRPSEDIRDALTVLSALVQLRLDDLGGDEAITELILQSQADRAAV